MKKIYYPVWVLILYIVILFTLPLTAVIPEEEREALIAVYTALDCDYLASETEHKGWKDGPLEEDGFALKGTEGKWDGIEVVDDHVTEVVLGAIDGYIPPEIGNFPFLEALFLNGRIKGSIPTEIGNLDKLVVLNIMGQIESRLPEEIGHLVNLQELMLTGPFSGKLPEQLGKLKSLQTLVLLCSEMRGIIPLELGNLTNLEKLDIYIGKGVGPIPAELGNLIKLKKLRIIGEFTGSLPPALGQLQQLKELCLECKGLSGGIPAEFGNLYMLTDLTLWLCEVGGTIPAELGNLVALKKLNLHGNKLHGLIPAELGNLSALREINFGNNLLSGSIPESLGYLKNLKKLSLQDNCLTGALPATLGNLTGLRSMHIDCNALTGPIPIQLTALKPFPVSMGYNGFYTYESRVRVFLSKADSDWENTQTVSPTGIKLTPTSPTTMKVTWKLIKYKLGCGGYLVYYSENRNGPWTYAGITQHKQIASLEVENLKPGTTYYFYVQTQTDPYGGNENMVLSEPGNIVSAKTKVE